MDNFKEFADAFEKLKNGYARIREDNKRTAWDFNIFQLLEVERYEVYTHSSMLKDLLDSHGTHGQGNLFFKELLSILYKKGIIQDEITSYSNKTFDDYLCIAEKSAETGRFDIEISRLHGDSQFYFVIENKIDAPDQERQIERYWEVVRKIKVPANRQKIFYLTTDGKKPSEESVSEMVRKKLENKNILYCISYREDIKSWLEKSLEKVESEKVKHTVRQYLDVVKTLKNTEDICLSMMSFTNS